MATLLVVGEAAATVLAAAAIMSDEDTSATGLAKKPTARGTSSFGTLLSASNESFVMGNDVLLPYCFHYRVVVASDAFPVASRRT